ncbi:MAG: glycosyltransferase [Tannerellaceae bacterium]|jgi:glycosyltransferase involved in cell wall biosynthesis|nr:glycosyltransferase [Tannerellaceae bacterium]
MSEAAEMPDYLFESSWEVCNKVGGIYTVLSTKAHTLQEIYPDKIIFIGPDVWKKEEAPDFSEDETLFAGWREQAATEGLYMKTGRWEVPGKPIVVLIDYSPFFSQRNELFYQMWDCFGVDSMHAYGDYDESCVFAYAAGRVIESFYNFYQLDDKKVVALFNEWMLGMGALYIRKRLPAVATLFTTHATSVGRSISGNNKPLYSMMKSYDGDQMAQELNMEAKHSVEKQAARHVDCFTTVSDITAAECKQLLYKAPDIVTPNGFERNFVPEGEVYTKKREKARNTLIRVAEKLLGCPIHPNAILLSTSGRYEYRNKGIDVFIDAMDRLRHSEQLQRDVIAFIMVPAWTKAVRADLKFVIEKDYPVNAPLQMPFATHWLNWMEQDKILNYIIQKGFTNEPSEKLKIIFAPCYLTGRDGIFNTSYYDLLIGMDATIYPSYYEPWGYTPLESIAFGIPTITTDLAGFGLWAKKEGIGEDITQGVRVIHRTDTNYQEVTELIMQTVLRLCTEKKAGLAAIRERCYNLASLAEWDKFIVYYQAAYGIALQNACKRMVQKND